MSTKNPAFLFYAKDWLTSPKVCCMPLALQGAFVRLLCYCWDSGNASLTSDEAELAVLSGAGEGWLNGGYSPVRDCFIPHPDFEDKLTNKKMLELHRERQDWLEKSRRGGKKSAAKRLKVKVKKQSKGGSKVVDDCLQPKGNTASASSSASSKRQHAASGDDFESPGDLVPETTEEFISRWRPKIKRPDFGQIDKGDKFANEAIRAGLSGECDRRNIITLWHWMKGRLSRGKVDSPAGLFLKLWAKGEWEGSDADEAAAIAYMDRGKRVDVDLPQELNVAVNAAAIDDIGGLDD